MNNNLDDSIKTKDGSLTMLHPEHGEMYHSSEGAMFEALYLYIKSSNFANSTLKTINVLDVGLGLGYNALSTIDAWMNMGVAQALRIFSLEINSSLIAELLSGNAQWQKNWPESWINLIKSFEFNKAANTWTQEYKLENTNTRTLHWKIINADASNLEFDFDGQKMDYIWQDPFSPKNNPLLWDAKWFTKLKQHSSQDCVLMTYSAARSVKDALAEAGWTYEKISTPGIKKHWIKAKIKNDNCN